jgi:hypothetical protein
MIILEENYCKIFFMVAILCIYCLAALLGKLDCAMNVVSLFQEEAFWGIKKGLNVQPFF